MRARSLAPDLYNAQAFASLLARDLGPNRKMTAKERAVAEAKAAADKARADARAVAAAREDAKTRAKKEAIAKQNDARAEARARLAELERTRKEEGATGGGGSTPVQVTEEKAASESKVKPWHIAAGVAFAAAVYYVWRRRSAG